LAWLSHRLLYISGARHGAERPCHGTSGARAGRGVLGRGKLPATFWIYPLRGVHFVLSRLLMAAYRFAHYGCALPSGRAAGMDCWPNVVRPPPDGSAPAASAPASRSGDAGGFWRIAPWLMRLVLVAPVILFIRIG